MRTDRSLYRFAAFGAIAALALAACSSAATTAPSAAAPSAAAPSAMASSGTDLTSLIAAAKAEGGLTTIALPRSWCGYGALLDGFTAKYGIPINNLNPDGSSQQ